MLFGKKVTSALQKTGSKVVNTGLRMGRKAIHSYAAGAKKKLGSTLGSMASRSLSALGTTAGASLGGPAGGAIGGAIGRGLSRVADRGIRKALR